MSRGRHRLLRRLGLSAAGAALVVAACGDPAPSPTPTAAPSATPAATASPTPARSPTPAPSGDERAIYAAIEEQVLAERGLPAKQRIVPALLSGSEVKARIAAQFERDNSPDEIAVAEETMKALGLLPADAALGTLYVDLLGSQVAGFYDPKTKEMVVVSKSGAVGPNEKVTFAHEFTHALQDQSFGLEGIDVDAVGQGDRSLGRLALVEGDATLLMTRWLVDHLSPEELQVVVAVDPDSLDKLASMPAILRETLLFPYQQGLVFVNGIWAQGGWEAVDRTYARLPDSTEQVLHPAKYEAGEKPVALPLDAAALAKGMGAGWTGTPEDTMGEFQLSVWLRENGSRALDAQRAAAGWGGDRLAYLRGPGGAYGLVLLSTWDTPEDADEFLRAAKTAVGRLPGAAMVGAGGDARSVRIFAADSEATLDRLGKAFAAANP
jgi:hypothetical protein